MIYKITLIGAGNMGSAFYRGLIEKFDSEQITVCDPSEEKLNALTAPNAPTALPSNFSTNADDVLNNSDIVLFAVKPQSFDECITGIKTSLEDKLVISIMAGISVEKLQKKTGSSRVVRSMPNLCAQVGESVTGWIASDGVSDEDREVVKKIFGAVGEEIELDREELIDAVSATSGAGPAYLFLLCELLGENIERLGFSGEEARRLAEQTLIGSAEVLKNDGRNAGELREAVTSKGGVTLEALNVFKEKGLDTICTEAIDAAVKRSGEIGK